jgi:hypothetical protein
MTVGRYHRQLSISKSLLISSHIFFFTHSCPDVKHIKSRSDEMRTGLIYI